MFQTGTFTGFEAELREPGIAWLRFNTPERLNGMTHTIKRDLVEAITQAGLDNRVRVLVFTGTGRAFNAGDDLGGYGRTLPGQPLVPAIHGGHDSGIGTYDGLRLLSQSVNLAIRACDKLSIAAINGIAIQTGFSLALACDFRIAADTARVGSATLRFGLLPDEGGQYLLVQMMGVAKTMEFLMKKRIVDAKEALELGLLHEVVAANQLETRAMDFATDLANGPNVSMRLLKRSIYNAYDLSMEQSFDEIAAKTAISDHHPDAREGVSAFREKRAAKFNRWLERSEDKSAHKLQRVRDAIEHLQAEIKRAGLETQMLGQLEQQLLRQAD